jgi:hypothetical protein
LGQNPWITIACILRSSRPFVLPETIMRQVSKAHESSSDLTSNIFPKERDGDKG